MRDPKLALPGCWVEADTRPEDPFLGYTRHHQRFRDLPSNDLAFHSFEAHAPSPLEVPDKFLSPTHPERLTEESWSLFSRTQLEGSPCWSWVWTSSCCGSPHSSACPCTPATWCDWICSSPRPCAWWRPRVSPRATPCSQFWWPWPHPSCSPSAHATWASRSGSPRSRSTGTRGRPADWDPTEESYQGSQAYHVVVRVEWGERYGATEICLFALRNRHTSLIEMLFREPEVHDVHMLVVLGEYKVWLK